MPPRGFDGGRSSAPGTVIRSGCRSVESSIAELSKGEGPLAEWPPGLKVEVDSERGHRVNGEPVNLRGGCMHHDNGLPGACVIDRAEERRVELMKAHGFNAIRTAHNPPSSAFLDACDRLGMLVMDEAFDQWERQKNGQDYHLYFNDWWKRDLDSMVLRDRNHPAVIMWSIGNEIPGRAQPRGRGNRQAAR